MILVALLDGPGVDDATCARLAADLGLAAFDARQMLASGYPAIVQTALDAAASDATTSSLRARGWDATAMPEERVVPSEAMVAIDRFAFEPAALRSGDRELPYDAIRCLLRATHRTRLDVEHQVSERRFSAGRSLLTGGLSNTTQVTRRVTESQESREQVLYAFRRDEELPWILHETRAHYAGLGPHLARTQKENFETTVRLLRENARGATYDDRLVGYKRVPERPKLRVAARSQTIATSSAWGTDVLANLLAFAIARGPAESPYRL